MDPLLMCSDHMRQHIGRIRSVLLPLLSLFLIAAGGCASLPDVSPFVDATYQLKSAVVESGKVVADELRNMEGGEPHAKKLNETWDKRAKAFAAIAFYADSLQAIVSSGEKGAESAEKLADSVKGLAEAAGIALPGSPAAIAVATDALKLIAQNISRARAASSLEKAMVNAQQAIEDILKLIMPDLNDLDAILRLSNKKLENKFRNSYQKRLGSRESLEEYIYKANMIVADEEEILKLVKFSELLKATDGWYAEYLEGLKDINKRLRLGRLLIGTVQSSVDQWLNAHRQVVAALKNRQPVSTRSLLEASVQIRNIIKKVHEL